MTGRVATELSHILQLVENGELPEEELRQILFSYVRGARYDYRPTSGVEYVDEHENVLLTATYDDDALTGLLAGPCLTEDMVEAIGRDVDRAVADNGFQIWRTVLFAWKKTEGYWRYGDRFQILPVPAEAPRPGWLVAEHPLVLEVRYRKSVTGTLDHIRAQHETRTAALLLALLVEFGIHPQSRFAAHQWVLAVDQPPPDMKMHSEFLQVGYYFDSFTTVSDDFTDPAVSQCEVVPDQEYFKHFGGPVSDELTVPALLGPSLDRFFALGVADQARFLRAFYWFALSSQLWPLSHSASYNALAQAIEVLLPASSGAPDCPSCHRPTGPGPTRKFSDFVEQYAPGIDRKQRSRLYGIRSALSHGGHVFLGDDGDYSFAGIHPRWADERQNHDMMQQVARTALISRLLATAETPLS
jgi:hypothetical protein